MYYFIIFNCLGKIIFSNYITKTIMENFQDGGANPFPEQYLQVITPAMEK